MHLLVSGRYICVPRKDINVAGLDTKAGYFFKGFFSYQKIFRNFGDF